MKDGVCQRGSRNVTENIVGERTTISTITTTQDTDGFLEDHITQEEISQPGIARSCSSRNKGPMVQKDIDTKKGWIKLHCEGGCIELHKIR